MKTRPWLTLPLLLVSGLLVLRAGGDEPELKVKVPGVEVRLDGEAARDVEQAIAVLRPVGQSGVSGTIHFTRKGDSVAITGRIKGLEPGQHGFHVHQYGDLSDLQEGKSAGGHYDPTGKPHGKPTEEERHVGDLGNIEANEQGVAVVNKRDAVIQLSGPHSILGRAIVVHADPDEFTQPSGDAGPRVAIGVIGIANPKK